MATLRVHWDGKFTSEEKSELMKCVVQMISEIKTEIPDTKFRRYVFNLILKGHLYISSVLKGKSGEFKFNPSGNKVLISKGTLLSGNFGLFYSYVVHELVHGMMREFNVENLFNATPKWERFIEETMSILSTGFKSDKGYSFFLNWKKGIVDKGFGPRAKATRENIAHRYVVKNLLSQFKVKNTEAVRRVFNAAGGIEEEQQSNKDLDIR